MVKREVRTDLWVSRMLDESKIPYFHLKNISLIFLPIISMEIKK